MNFKFFNIKNSIKGEGFTLIELLVVIAIVAILATLILVGIGRARESARDTDRIRTISQVRSFGELYYMFNGFSYVGMESELEEEIGSEMWEQVTIVTAVDDFCIFIELENEEKGTMCLDKDLKLKEGEDCLDENNNQQTFCD